MRTFATVTISYDVADNVEALGVAVALEKTLGEVLAGKEARIERVDLHRYEQRESVGQLHDRMPRPVIGSSRR